MCVCAYLFAILVDHLGAGCTTVNNKVDFFAILPQLHIFTDVAEGKKKLSGGRKGQRGGGGGGDECSRNYNCHNTKRLSPTSILRL